jgi:hypothetical protein
MDQAGKPSSTNVIVLADERRKRARQSTEYVT